MENKNEFLKLLSVYKDEYRKSKSWCEVLKHSYKYMEDNLYDQKCRINKAFDATVAEINSKRKFLLKDFES